MKKRSKKSEVKQATRTENQISEVKAFNENQVEGRNPVLEVFRAGRTVDKLLIARGSREGSILEIIRRAKEQGVVVQEVDRRRLDELSLTNGAHQGVIAFVSPYSYVEIEDILAYASEKGEAP